MTTGQSATIIPTACQTGIRKLRKQAGFEGFGRPWRSGDRLVGSTVNVASRLNQCGKANEVIIGAETHQRIKNAGLPVVCKSLGAAILKGKEKEVHVYQVSLAPEKKKGLMPATQMEKIVVK